MSKLYLFTASFSFGNQETFLEDEIRFLSKAFETVRIVPLGGFGEDARPCPQNCVVDNSLHCTRKAKVIKGFIHSYRVLPSFLGDFFMNKVYRSKKKTKSWFSSLLLCSYYLQSSAIRNLKTNIDSSDVIYSYWGVSYNIFFPWFKGKVKLVSRFHGDWDLWRSNTKEGYIPLREKVIDSLDLAVSISNKGKDFLLKQHPNMRCVTGRLGTRDCGLGQRNEDGVLRVVSCSTVYPLKRVPLIFESVKAYSRYKKVYWTHIGGSPNHSHDYFEDLKEIVENNKSENLQVMLMGSLKMDDVLAYYKNNPVDVFINLSTNEGVPVSIMEAISFNIPIVATDVGATSDIVNADTGILVSANPTAEDVAIAIAELLKRSINPRSYWENNYYATKNYTEFAELLKRL